MERNMGEEGQEERVFASLKELPAAEDWESQEVPCWLKEPTQCWQIGAPGHLPGQPPANHVSKLSFTASSD